MQPTGNPPYEGEDAKGKAPDFPQTRLALRTWQLDRPAMQVRSLNAPMGKKTNWIARQMAQPAGNWPHDKPLQAACALSVPARRRRKKGEEEEPPHGPVPSPDCSCGIYATTDLDIVNGYLRRDAPVLGVVELGGRLIPATQGYRAAYARVAAILLVDEALTEPHGLLRELAGAYRVPALVPHSSDPDDYREAIGLTTIAGEAEEWLRQAGGEAA
jgi:hypothetical protein